MAKKFVLNKLNIKLSLLFLIVEKEWSLLNELKKIEKIQEMLAEIAYKDWIKVTNISPVRYAVKYEKLPEDVELSLREIFKNSFLQIEIKKELNKIARRGNKNG